MVSFCCLRSLSNWWMSLISLLSGTTWWPWWLPRTVHPSQTWNWKLHRWSMQIPAIGNLCSIHSCIDRINCRNLYYDWVWERQAATNPPATNHHNSRFVQPPKLLWEGHDRWLSAYQPGKKQVSDQAIPEPWSRQIQEYWEGGFNDNSNLKHGDYEDAKGLVTVRAVHEWVRLLSFRGGILKESC